VRKSQLFLFLGIPSSQSTNILFYLSFQKDFIFCFDCIRKLNFLLLRCLDSLKLHCFLIAYFLCFLPYLLWGLTDFEDNILGMVWSWVCKSSMRYNILRLIRKESCDLHHAVCLPCNFPHKSMTSFSTLCYAVYHSTILYFYVHLLLFLLNCEPISLKLLERQGSCAFVDIFHVIDQKKLFLATRSSIRMLLPLNFSSLCLCVFCLYIYIVFIIWFFFF